MGLQTELTPTAPVTVAVWGSVRYNSFSLGNVPRLVLGVSLLAFLTSTGVVPVARDRAVLHSG